MAKTRQCKICKNFLAITKFPKKKIERAKMVVTIDFGHVKYVQKYGDKNDMKKKKNITETYLLNVVEKQLNGSLK